MEEEENVVSCDVNELILLHHLPSSPFSSSAFDLFMENKSFYIIVSTTLVLLLILAVVLRIRLGATPTFFAIAGVDWAVQSLLFVWIIIRLVRERQGLERRVVETAIEGDRRLRVEYSFLRRVAGLPTKFRFRDLDVATDHFQALLGMGATASVFKGILDDGSPVAVKRLDASEHSNKEFLAEVMAIASVQHRNLVRLLGYCCENDCRLLVYEFIHNGSLESWIFPSKRRDLERRVLPMDMRFEVAVDVAKALAYLHEDCRNKILHLDVKPENILIDERFVARVTDFGLSKLMSTEESRVMTTMRGTKGYLAPEWLLENGISEKTDVYSYGMVLLEMVGGRRNVLPTKDAGPALANGSQSRWSFFPKMVMEKVKEGKLMEMVDTRVSKASVQERQVTTLVHVALWCIQQKPKLRPSMSQVVDMLQGRRRVESPPEPEMMLPDLLSFDDDEDDEFTGSTNQRHRNINDHGDAVSNHNSSEGSSSSGMAPLLHGFAGSSSSVEISVISAR